MKQKTFMLCILTIGLWGILSPTSAQYFKFENPANKKAVERQVEGILKFFDSLVGGGMFHTADLHSTGGADFGLTGVVASVPKNLKDCRLLPKRIYSAWPSCKVVLVCLEILSCSGGFFTYRLAVTTSRNFVRPTAVAG